MSKDNGSRERHLPAGRRAELAAYIAQTQHATVAELSERFNVSIDTVRRDLDQLDREGILIRSHGGAISLTGSRNDRALDVRLQLQVSEKEKIATLAAALIPDGSVIMLNAGTTSLAVARALRNHRELTIATNNLRIPTEISAKAFRDLYVFGGSVRTVTQSTTGPVSFTASTENADIDIRCDLALIAVGAVNLSGYSTSNLAEAAMMAEMMRRAEKTVVLADSSKLGRRLFAQVAPLEQADFLITDTTPNVALNKALTEAEVQVLTPEN